ncbi:nodulation protein NfeD [bacterium]|nr:nodulation protein NfeD [bacterium]MBU1993835.1 nodulation protein NfeD [bacterium]
MKRLLLLLLLTFLPFLACASTILKLEIKGVIGPASSKYLKEGLAAALHQNAQIILIELDTPGGLSTSMREMVQGIANSSIPVVIYVSPKGAHAASAGTYLLYASHVAAMAPGTNLGAATPVQMMPTPKIADSNTSVLSALEKKSMNDAIAYIKSLAQLNERNVTWAIDAVHDAKSLSAQDALKYGVIDLMADNIEELLVKLDERKVQISGKSLVLKTKGSVIHNFEADWKTDFLFIITNPNVAYIFLLIGIYGIFFELMNPGALFPGVIGAVSGVVALYALNMIPFNYAGLLLIILGIAFMVAEVFIAGFGIFGIGGAIAFAFGSILLFDADTLGSSISMALIIAFSIVSLAFFILLMRLFLHARSAKIVSGAEEMVGADAKVLEISVNGYKVLCHGETWNAVSQSKLSVAQSVRVTELSDLILKVKPIEE